MRGIHALYATAIATTVCTVGLIVVATIGRPVPTVVAGPDDPVYVVAVATTSDHNQPAVIRASLSTATDLLSPGGSGLVTAVVIRDGSHLDDGTELYAVDGVSIHAIVGATPLYRVLSLGDTGPDVALLQGFLSRHTPIAVSEDGKFGTATASAVRAWQRVLGLSPDGVADPRWFVRLDAPGDVAAVQIATGKTAPATGDVVATMQAALSSVEVTADEPLDPGEYIILTSTGRTGITYDGHTWTPLDPAGLLTLLQGEGSMRPAPNATAGSNHSNTDSDSLTSLSGGSVQLSARLALATPIPALTVPPEALVASESGTGACAWLQTVAGHEREEGIVVEGTTASGAVLVRDVGLTGRQILLDPASTMSDAACP